MLCGNIAPAVPILLRGYAGCLFKNLGKVALVFKAAECGDIDEADGIVQKIKLTLFNTNTINIIEKAVAGFFLEHAAEIGTAQVNMLRNVIKRDFCGVVALDIFHDLINNVRMLYLREIKGVIDEPVHNTAKPYRKIVKVIEPFNFRYIV